MDIPALCTLLLYVRPTPQADINPRVTLNHANILCVAPSRQACKNQAARGTTTHARETEKFGGQAGSKTDRTAAVVMRAAQKMNYYQR